MRYFLSILAGLLMALSIATNASAHSVERAGCAETVSMSAAHFDGDCDQVPGDVEKGYPHHHGACHGHHVAAPVQTAEARARPMPATRVAAGAVTRLTPAEAETRLRPPRA